MSLSGRIGTYGSEDHWMITIILEMLVRFQPDSLKYCLVIIYNL
nr:MAG TPA: hypothetical protein [Bacteriophage sp.]